MNNIPLIVQAAKASNIRLATLLYQSANISVLPVKTDKSPALRHWAQLQSRIAHKETIEQWHNTGLLSGVGLILGRVSGNLVVIDCDGLEAVAAFEAEFPKLAETYTVRTGSGKGAHFYFYVKWCPKTTRALGVPGLGNVELRSDGSYVVAPPSGHASGNRYEVSKATHIKHVFDLHEVMAWIDDLQPKRTPERKPERSSKPQSSKYGQVALAGECAAVRMAATGNRNNQLYRSALKLGSLIADDRLNRDTVESDLLDAAASLVSEDGHDRVLKTIRSGIAKGMESSRDKYKSA